MNSLQLIRKINLINLREYALNRYGQVDDYQFGGGAGMVMMIEPIKKCIDLLNPVQKLT